MDRMSVFIEPGSCWGRIVGEDSGSGACDLCVQICPAVFEKPTPGHCARVRAHADVAGYSEHVLRAVQGCPVDAIRVTIDEEPEITRQRYKWVPIVDEERCTECGLCVEACGPCCLQIVSEIAILVRPNACTSEEHCIDPCRDDAIHMQWVPMRGDRHVGKWKVVGLEVRC